jgi:O-antigen ligase
MILQRPWLGYGYSAFWTGLDYSTYIWEVIGWPAPHAHNGLLDLWLDLGILGVTIFVISFLTTLVKALAWVRYTQSSEYLWPIIYLTFMLLVNLTQNIIITQNDIFWIMYVTISFWKPVQHYRSAKLPIGTNPNKGGWLKDV